MSGLERNHIQNQTTFQIVSIYSKDLSGIVLDYLIILQNDHDLCIYIYIFIKLMHCGSHRNP